MFSKKNNSNKLDAEQCEMYEYARQRAKQKKRLFKHFVALLVGSVVLIIINVVLGYREDFTPLGYNWFLWVVLLWAVILLIHTINVFIIDKFMGKEWQQQQLDKLVKKQKDKIIEMQKKVEKDYPTPSEKKNPVNPEKHNPQPPQEKNPTPTRISENDPRNPEKP
jgi:uncharacterized protein YhhL (DUF1145 family)